MPSGVNPVCVGDSLTDAHPAALVSANYPNVAWTTGPEVLRYVKATG